MTDQERKDELEREEAAIRASLLRSMTALTDAQDEIRLWLTKPRRPDSLPPRDMMRAAFDVQIDVHDLLRVRLWRARFA